MTAAGITLAACQSKGYQIEGTAEGFENGDTLFLTIDPQGNTPRDTLIVQDGKFFLSGETDSTYICMIYSAKNENIGMPFFIEPGIKVLLSKEPNASQVGGTHINEELQRMNDAAAKIGQEINNIAEKFFADGETTEEDQQKAMKQVDQLHEQFNEIVRETAKRNIKNELGYYLLSLTSNAWNSSSNSPRRCGNGMPLKKWKHISTRLLRHQKVRPSQTSPCLRSRGHP